MDHYTEPDFECAAFISIDMQNDFVLPGAVAEIPETHAVLPNIEKLLRFARGYALPIIHVIRLYKPGGENADLCRKSAIESGKQIVCPGTRGADIVSSLKPNDMLPDAEHLLGGDLQGISAQEWILYKSRWGAFYQTPLEDFLRNHDVNTLIFCGCNFPNCPRTSIYEASERDFRIVLVSDAMSQVYPKGLEEMKGIGVSLLTTMELMTQY